jgi:hypothetical protein
MFPEPVAGHRVGYQPASGLLWAEGHPSGDKSRLGGPQALRRALSALEERLGELDVEIPARRRYSGVCWQTGPPVPGFAGVRRLDLAVDLASATTAEGLALLAGIAAMRPSGRLAADVRRQPGGRAVETVSWLGVRGKVARAYDKGVEACSAPRGELVRLEDQRRWPREHRRDAVELTAEYCRSLFQRRFEPLRRASKGVIVTNLVPIAERLYAHVEAGELKPGHALQAIGSLVAEQAGLEFGHRTTAWRHRRRVQDLGLVLADGCLEEVEVDLHGVLAEAVDDGVWGDDG